MGQFNFLSTSPPLIEGPGFLRGRGVFNCVGTFGPLITPEGGVSRHFHLLFIGSQKFTFLRRWNIKYLNGGRGSADIKWSGPIIGGLVAPNCQQKASNQFAFFKNVMWCFHKVMEPFISKKNCNTCFIHNKYMYRLFYSCLLCDPVFEWHRGWRWPCFDTNLSAFVMLTYLYSLLTLEQLDLHNKSSEVCIKTRSPPASLPFKGQVTEPRTVKWSIVSFNK